LRMVKSSQLYVRRAAASCSVCGAPAVVRISYARLDLCTLHFREFVERKIARILKKTGLSRARRVIVAVSGGKDSAAMLYALASMLKKDNVELIGVHINLGLGEYSEESMKKAHELCHRVGIPCIIVELEKVLGVTVPELAKRARRPTCSVCGLVKRYILNAVAVEADADYVATGHTADDIIAYTLKEFMFQNMDGVSKLAPSTSTVKGLAVGRVRPLYEVTERESLLYSLINGIPFHHSECPYRPRAPIEQRIKEFVNKLEEEHPGIKITYIRRLERNMGMYHSWGRESSYGRCKHCGLASSGVVCGFCRLTEKVTGKPLGEKVRAWIRGVLASLRAEESLMEVRGS